MFVSRSSRSLSPSERSASDRRVPAGSPGAALICLASAGLVLTACGGSGSTGTPPDRTSTPQATSTTAPTAVPSGGTAGAPGTRKPTSTTPGTTKPAPSTSTAKVRVVAYRETYAWNWPNDPDSRGSVQHRPTAPAVPQLVRISAGRHPHDPGEYGFERVSFTFTTAFPSYRFEFADLIGDPSGKPVAIKGLGPLTIVFTNAQAHTATMPVRSSIVSQPRRPLDYERIVDYARAGDFEAVLTYGLGMTWDIPQSNPQFMVRVIEVETVTPTDQHQFTVAFDVQLGNVARH